MNPSDSNEQREAEEFIREVLSNELGFDLEKFDASQIQSGARPNAINYANKTIVEISAHIGALKSAQMHKAKGDILKLIYVEKELGGKWTKILCFADELAAKFVLGKSWVAKAAKAFDIKVHRVNLPEEQINRVKLAQKRQRMVNPE